MAILPSFEKISIDNQRLKSNKCQSQDKLSLEDMLLMALEYMREYRTYFHISQSYGVSETSAYKAVKWIEDTLIKHPDFALPGYQDVKNC
ncbi:hypothetical protein NEOC84_000797|nr:hypothetical protein [Neochlamydia sp. AcF84]